jgi:hypothetical protein
MNETEENMGHIERNLVVFENVSKLIFGSVEKLYCTDTYQFNDYSKVLATRFDPIAKAKRREEVFPMDCQKANEMGKRLIQM